MFDIGIIQMSKGHSILLPEEVTEELNFLMPWPHLLLVYGKRGSENNNYQPGLEL